MEKPNVLVIDDEPGVRALIADLLSARGYECKVAEGAPQALSMFPEFRCEVVLSDINMAGMDGLELTRTLLRRSPDTAVILMTGHADIHQAIQALRLGASDFL